MSAPPKPRRGSKAGEGFRRRLPDLELRAALAAEAPFLRRGSRAKKTAKPNPQTRAPITSAISFGPEICADLSAAEQREWLVTNGLGGYASGTIAGCSTRRYHGLLFAALHPPAARTQLVSGVDEIAHVGNQRFELATRRWLSGAVAPEGYKLLENFRREGSSPVWTYQLGAARLEKRIWMQHGENTTFVHYTLFNSPMDLELKVLVNYRDFHSTSHAGFPPGEWRMRIDPIEYGIRIIPFDGATPFYLKSASASYEPQHTWYRDFFFALERERGLDDHEDQLLAAIFRAELKPGQSVALVFSTNPDATLDAGSALALEHQRQSEILAAAASFISSASSLSFASQLVLAADQFLASSPLPGHPDAKTIIAGFHWFGDWGRDTMIALPGLALTTGRPEIAKQILLRFAEHVDRGILPNNFPDAGGTPQYNTIDATLWYFEAIRQYQAATSDADTLRQLFPVLERIIAAHLAGTRYNIHVDPSDGLLYGGGPGVQLTWMDAKIGEWVVTPRTGKPVEINALWLNALDIISAFADLLGYPQAPAPKPPWSFGAERSEVEPPLRASSYAQRAACARASFAKFWNPDRNCCFDVLDSPGIGNDAALRPNQLFAVSLGTTLLTPDQQKAVVDTCAAHLLTPYGLRTLASGEAGYAPRYTGGPRERDAAYHQGTVWPWLLGPFVEAHFRVYNDRAAARAFLEPLVNALTAGRLDGGSFGLGTLPEIFDAEPPHAPRGAVSQAWSVAELLRVWHRLSSDLP